MPARDMGTWSGRLADEQGQSCQGQARSPRGALRLPYQRLNDMPNMDHPFTSFTLNVATTTQNVCKPIKYSVSAKKNNVYYQTDADVALIKCRVSFGRYVIFQKLKQRAIALV